MRRLILALIAALCLTSSAKALSLRVTVYDAIYGNRTIAGCPVTVYDHWGAEVANVYTNGIGNADFNGLTTGDQYRYVVGTGFPSDPFMQAGGSVTINGFGSYTNAWMYRYSTALTMNLYGNLGAAVGVVVNYRDPISNQVYYVGTSDANGQVQFSGYQTLTYTFYYNGHQQNWTPPTNNASNGTATLWINVNQ